MENQKETPSLPPETDPEGRIDYYLRQADEAQKKVLAAAREAQLEEGKIQKITSYFDLRRHGATIDPAKDPQGAIDATTAIASFFLDNREFLDEQAFLGANLEVSVELENAASTQVGRIKVTADDGIRPARNDLIRTASKLATGGFTSGIPDWLVEHNRQSANAKILRPQAWDQIDRKARGLK